MFGRIFFDKKRYNIKASPKAWSNQRIASAKRSLQKAREKAGLFGEELMEFTTVEQRLTTIDKSFIQRVKDFRNSDAKLLWEIRKKFRALPEDVKNDIEEYWNYISMPKEPFRFASLLHQYEKDPLYFKRLKGLAHAYTRTIVNGNEIKVVEISKEESYMQIYNIDSNK